MIKRQIILLLFAVSLQAQTTYYVSSSEGDDAYTGTSQSSPWQTINKVRRSTFVAGDSIRFKCDDAFIGNLTNNLVGTSANRIVLCSYGTGNNPIFYGDLTTAVWLPCAGYDSVWVTKATEYPQDGGNTWQDSLGVKVTVKKSGSPSGFKQDTRALLLARLKSYRWSMVGGYYGSDSIYIKTWNGSIPNAHIFESNVMFGSHVTIQDIEFRNCWEALTFANGTDVIYQRLTAHNTMGVSFFFKQNMRNAVAYGCRVDTAGYTAFYTQYNYGNKFQYDTASNVKANLVLGIQRPGYEPELCGVGLQEDTNALVENCVFTNCDAGVDTYHNVNDTIRFCKIVTCNSGMQISGIHIVYSNTISVVGRYDPGITVGMTSFGETKIHDNIMTVQGDGIRFYSTSGGTASFYNNTITGTYSNNGLAVAYVAGGTFSNNHYHLPGRFSSGAWPNEVFYTFVQWQAAGYDAGSCLDDGCGSSPDIAISASSLLFGSVTSDDTSAEQTYSLSGSNLSPSSGDITVTAPTGFQVSKTTGTGFASSITCAYTAGTLASTTIYVRFLPTSATSYSGNITNAGGGATTQNVAVTGTGTSVIIVLTATSGNNQSGLVGTTLNPITLTATSSGDAVQGVYITWTILHPDGSAGQEVSSSGALTNASGQVTTVPTLGNLPGDYIFRAAAPTLVQYVDFEMRAFAGQYILLRK